MPTTALPAVGRLSSTPGAIAITLYVLIRQQWHWNRTPGLRSLAELLLARRRQRRLRASLTASS